ncbi:hypothetical protein Adt_27472 [Abeliophyllum distichum]|uniref:Uncharacterized protein n=1 Tax=Abeliophyllum distichum TaxID=126358 RepID=A0ABD1RXW6_9LAMI
MGDSNRKHPNEPDQPTTPPDLAPLLVGHISPATTNPNTGLTPLQSGLPIAETLGVAPSVAAASSIGDQPTGLPPMDAPPLGDLIGGSILPQTLAPSVLHLVPSRRVLPATSGPFVLANSPPISDVPYSASLTSSQLIVPATDQPLPRADGSRTHMPSPQAPSGASNQQAIGGFPGFVGLPLNQMIEPSMAPESVPTGPADEPLPAHGAWHACPAPSGHAGRPPASSGYAGRPPASSGHPVVRLRPAGIRSPANRPTCVPRRQLPPAHSVCLNFQLLLLRALMSFHKKLNLP